MYDLSITGAGQMDVILQSVADVIETLFTVEPYILEDCVAFGFRDDTCKAEVVISMFNASEEGPVTDGVEFWVWLDNYDESRLTLPDTFNFADALVLCCRMQQDLRWCMLRPYEVEQGSIEIALYRSIDMSVEDLDLAAKANLNSSFLRTLKQLEIEWAQVAPIFAAIVTGRITSPQDIELLLAESTSMN